MNLGAARLQIDRRFRVWGELNKQIVELLVLIGQTFPGSRSPSLSFGWSLVSDVGSEIAQSAIDSPDDPTAAVRICIRFTRDVKQLRAEFKTTPQVEWFSRLLFLGFRMDRALRAMAEGDLPLEVQEEIGVAGAVDALRIEDHRARAAVAWWMAQNPEPAEDPAADLDEPSNQASR